MESRIRGAPGSGGRLRAADIISLSRIILLVPWIKCRLGGTPWSLPILALIAFTDIADGLVARMTGTASPSGGRIDIVCDLIVTLAAVMVLGIEDRRYAAVSALMALNFLSWALLGADRGVGTYTRTGKYNGAACYALIAVADAVPCLAARSGFLAFGLEKLLLRATALILIVSLSENGIDILRSRLSGLSMRAEERGSGGRDVKGDCPRGNGMSSRVQMSRSARRHPFP